MMTMKINKQIQQISEIVTNTKTMFMNQGNYIGLNDVKKLVVPEDMIDDNGNIKTIFGGLFELFAVADNNDSFDYDEFVIRYYNWPKEVCIEILTKDWSTVSTDIVGIGMNESTLEDAYGCVEYFKSGDCITACTNGEDVPLPITPAQAAAVCRSVSNDFIIKFR